MTQRYSPQRLAELVDANIILTDEQAEVVGAPLTSRLVVAGAGAGKTFVMSMRVVYLVANQLAQPEAVMGLTFTRKAAAELNERIRSMLARLPGEVIDDGDWLPPAVSTYDAYAAALVRAYGLAVGADPGARILTEAQRWSLARDVVEGWSGSGDVDAGASGLVGLLLVLADQTADNEVEPDELIDYFGRVIDDLESKPAGINPTTGRSNRIVKGIPEAVTALRTRRAAARLIGQYRTRKAEAGVMDFADQAAWARRLAEHGARSGIIAAEQERFSAVLLDEFQDTSASQIDFLAALFGQVPVMAVGDPNQSIYGWRGASATALTAFLDRFQALGPTGQPERPAVSHLTIARRNDRNILAVANRVAGPLRRGSPVDLPELRPRNGAAAGQVDSGYFVTQDQEAQAIATYLSRHWAPSLGGTAPATAAILVRSRNRIDPIVTALEEAGLDYQVIGRGGLLRVPEVRDLVSALSASHDLTRGDAFMRLATSARFAVGISDLEALARFARARSQPGEVTHSDELLQPIERLAVLDALEIIMSLEPGRTGDLGISPVGLIRLRRIGSILGQLRRAAAYLSLPELVLEAEKALGLDLDLLSSRRSGGRSQINRLVAEAHNYADGQDQASLTGFLDWLEAEDEISDGLDPADVPAPGGAIQVLTVHGAKGLEWDVVCVPGLIQGAFPAVDMKKAEDQYEPNGLGWLSHARRPGASGGLPWPLRLDKAGLPLFEHQQAEDVIELAARFEAFRRRAGEYFLAEDRRVAYVAMTRARNRLFVSGFWYAAGAKNWKPPSIFLNELVEAGLISDSTWDIDPPSAAPEQSSQKLAIWPPEHPAGTSAQALTLAAALVEAEAAGIKQVGPEKAVELLEHMGTDLAARAALLLRERDRPIDVLSVTLPEQTSVTTLIGLTGTAGDRLAAIRALRRPVPGEPNRGAGLGEEFHRRAALELLTLSGSPIHQDMLDSSLLVDSQSDAAAEAQLRSLMSKFRQSRWMSGSDSLLAVEAELETELAGRTVVARIDAIFRDQRGHIVVVDWKTGRSSKGRARPLHAEQVKLYQAALARIEGVATCQIEGYVHYIMENLSVPVRCPPDYLTQLLAELNHPDDQGSRAAPGPLFHRRPPPQ
jgi:DNA helicase-2/ATP-dependent DNA helicase PcrA